MPEVPTVLAVGARLAGVPVEPDADTARRWAVTELSDSVYHEQPSLLDLFLEWLLGLLADIEEAASGLDMRTAAVAAVAFLLLGTLVALAVAGPVRRARAANRSSAEVFVDDLRTAAELRAGADALAGQERWAEAVLDRFRAVLRSLEERALLDERPGRTAHEASLAAAARLPALADELHRAGRLFDDVCYGHAEATADDDAWLREVDARVAATRPAARGRGPGVNDGTGVNDGPGVNRVPV